MGVGEIYPEGVLVDVGVEVNGTPCALASSEFDSMMNSNRSTVARVIRA